MKFFKDRKDFTHTGSFYKIPIYLNLDDMEMPVISGQNIIYDWLFTATAVFHGTVVEFFAQHIANLFNLPHEAGFPFDITGKIEK
jgi:hypothetical protein